MVNQSNIPIELSSTPQWVAWQKKPRAGGKVGKMPINPHTGSAASVNDPSTWGTIDQALTMLQDGKDLAGIGFVFTGKDQFTGIDLDDCLDPDGIPIKWAEEIVDALDSYTEITPSGRGLHIITKGILPENRRRDKIEMYGKDRFFTVTGDHLEGTPKDIELRDNELFAVFTKNFGPAGEKACSESDLTAEDLALIKKAEQAKNGGHFKQLWKGDWSDYPSQSEAELALCKMLAYWSGNNLDQMERIFRRSNLMRPKWLKRGGGLSLYGKDTLEKATAPIVPITSPKQAVQESSFYLTDSGNAERMASRYGSEIRYCHAKKCWFVWDGQRWTEDRSNIIMQKAKQVVRSMYEEAAKSENYEKRQELVKHACKSESESRLSAMVSLARNESGIAIKQEELDQDPWLLNCLNGTVDLKTGKLLPHRRQDLITKLAQVDFDPTATCVTWQSFLERIMEEDHEMLSFLQRAVGYALTGDAGEQSMIIFHGSGANGKSTFLETVSGILSDYAMQTPTETLLVKRPGAMTNDVARLKGARFVTASESEFGQRLAEGLIKQMTGQDTISARFLHQEYFDFKPTHKIFLGTNHKPIIHGNENAIWRRIKLVPFEVTIPAEERDRNLPAKLKGEWPGILAWAVRGCLEWQKAGLGDPEAVIKATMSYRTEMDVFNDFLTDCCLETGQLQVTSMALYAAYTKWCEENGEKPLAKTILGRRLKDRGLKQVRVGSSGAKAWLGLGLASPAVLH
ncbi:MAG: hypothetical protein HGA96_00200 [Desulfobulbaceae bacterium]|nr:hypothetical protein [Desulfobulbaceae bacterium]